MTAHPGRRRTSETVFTRGGSATPDPQALDKCARSEPSSRGSKAARVVAAHVCIRWVDGESGEAVARAQGQALWTAAKSLGLVDQDNGGG